jgi:hypothetical protein
MSISSNAVSQDTETGVVAITCGVETDRNGTHAKSKSALVIG